MIRTIFLFIAIAGLSMSCSKSLDLSSATENSQSAEDSNAQVLDLDEPVTDSQPGWDENSAPVNNGQILVKPQQKTVAVTTANRALMNLVSCTGVGSPSARAQSMWEDKYGQFSVEGHAQSVTSPMMMAQAAVSAEICLDLILKEENLQANERRIFPSIDFSSSPNSQSTADLSDVVTRMARSCWGREETDTERNMIVQSAKDQFNSLDIDMTKTQMVYMCSVMLSSVATISM